MTFSWPEKPISRGLAREFYVFFGGKCMDCVKFYYFNEQFMFQMINEKMRASIQRPVWAKTINEVV